MTKRTIFWDVTPFSPVDVHRSFGGTCCLHLQGSKVSQTRNWKDGKQSEPSNSACRLRLLTFLFGLFFDLEDGGSVFI
jgi:hypothetical protein